MGGNDIADEGTWEWTDGTAWADIGWCGGEPNNSHGPECVSTRDEDCLVFGARSNGCWNDYPCTCGSRGGGTTNYICEAN